MTKDIEKIKELLKTDALDESVQEEVVSMLDEMVDAKAKVRAKEMTKKVVQPIIDEAVETKTVELEERFEEYKDMIITNFSNFVDEVFETELEIPDAIMENARKGELYSDLIDQFKTRLAIDEGVLEGEVKGLLKEARDEIVDLRESLDEKTGENFELKTDAEKMASHIYLQEKCAGLTESTKSHIMTIIGEETDVKVIDEKFEELVDIFVNEAKDDDDDEDVKGKGKAEVKEEADACVCPECGKETEVTEGACATYECSECEGVKLTEKKDIKESEDDDEDDDDKKEKKEKKDSDKDDDDDDDVDESTKETSTLMESWIKTAKENKF